MKKICTKCGEEKELNPKQLICFECKKKQISQYQKEHKEQYNKATQRFKERNLELVRERDKIAHQRIRDKNRKPKIVKTHKTCVRCKVEKPLSEFHTKKHKENREGHDKTKIYVGYNSHCKTCVSEVNNLEKSILSRKRSYIKYREKYLEKSREKGRNRTKEQREHDNELARNTRKKNPELYKRHARKYRKLHHEEILKKEALNRKLHPEKHRECVQRYKERYPYRIREHQIKQIEKRKVDPVYIEKNRKASRNRCKNITDTYIAAQCLKISVKEFQELPPLLREAFRADILLQRTISNQLKIKQNEKAKQST